MSLTIQNVANISLQGAHDIAYKGFGTRIYVAQNGAGARMSQIDWVTSLITPSSDPGDAKHVIWDGNGSFWTDIDANSGDPHVYQFNNAMGLIGSVDTGQVSPTYMAAESGLVWTANPDNDSVNLMNNGGLLANLPSFGGAPVQISGPLVDALGDIWYINSNDPSGSFQFANLSGVLAPLPAVFTGPNGMVFDGANFWFSDTDNNQLVQLSPAGAVLQSVPLGAIPIGLGFDGTYLWCGTIAPNTLQVVDLAGVIQANVAPPSAGTPIFVTSGIPGFTFVTYEGAGSIVAQFQIAGPPPVTPMGGFTGTLTGFSSGPGRPLGGCK